MWTIEDLNTSNILFTNESFLELFKFLADSDVAYMVINVDECARNIGVLEC